MNQPVPKQMLNTGQLPDQDNDAIDLASFLGLVIDSRWLIATVALIVTLIGIAYAFIARPIYQANILVQVEDSANSSANILGDLAGAFSVKSAATAEVEILRSRLVVSRAVNNAQLDLEVEPNYFPFVGQWIARHSGESSGFGFGNYAWGKVEANVAVFDIPEPLKGERFVLTATGNKSFSLVQADASINLTGLVGVPLNAETSRGPIRIRIDRLDAKKGTEFLITRVPMLDIVERLQNTLTIAEKGKQSGIIGVSLDGWDPLRTANTLNEIGKEYIRQNVERRSAEAEKSLEFLEKQLPAMKATLEEAESKYNALRNSRGTVDLNEEAKSILQQSVLSQTRLVELKQKRDELLTRYQESNPLVQAVDQQINTLSGEIEAVNRKIKTMPSIEQDVLRLTRDVKVNTDLYTSLLNSSQQLRLLKASKVGNARLLDQAVPPLHPIRPKRILVISIAILTGILIGVGCAFMRRNMFGGVEDPNEIEQILGLTVSAAIPFSAKQTGLFAQVQSRSPKVSVLAVDAPRDVAIESLRSFRTTLQFSMLGAKNNIVMITGPTPGVGKSFVSVNFAAVMASSGKKVLLIDADIRKGYLNSYFGIERQNGLTELITGSLQKDDAIHKAVLDNVDFISTGTLPPNPAELLGHPNLAALLRSVTEQYDFILVDTAPILAVTDAMVVAPHVGAIFNVVRGNVSTLGEIAESVKRISQNGNAVAGVLFNALKPNGRRYGYGFKYGKYRYEQYEY